MRHSVLLALVVSASVAAAESSSDLSEVQVFREGRAVSLPSEELVAEGAVRLAESCDVESTSYVEPHASWNAVVAAGGYVLLRFQPSRTLRVDAFGGSTMRAEQILAPLPHDPPGHVFVWSGDRVIGLTKCDHRPARELEVLLGGERGASDSSTPSAVPRRHGGAP